MGVEPADVYNRRIAEALESFQAKGESAAIIGKGRDTDEQSLVLVENGIYMGFGFFNRDVSITDFESARTYVRTGAETPTVQNLINSYLTNPRDAEVVVF
jgi:DNA polymerase-3 subunit epsilon